MSEIAIFINEKKAEVKPDTEIVFDFQACDVTKPDTIQTGYSNVFELPDTKTNRQIAGVSDDLDIVSDVPYRKNEARIEVDGVELVPNGVALLDDDYEPGRAQQWQIFSGNIDFFRALEGKSIRDLRFTQYEHLFNATNVVGSFARTEGYVYSIIHRGKRGQSTEFRYFDLYPSTFAKAIFDEIFEEAGFSYDWAREPGHLFDRLIVPSSNSAKLSQEYRDARRSYLSAKNWRARTGVTPPEGSDIYWTTRGERTIPFSNDSEDGFLQGENALYNKTTNRYKADDTYFVDVFLFVAFKSINVSFGRITVRLALYKNGQQIARADFAKTGPSINFGPVLQINAERILLNEGDELQAKIIIIRETITAAYDVVIQDSNNIVIDITVREDFPPGSRVRLQDFLPDISQTEFVKSIIFLFCLLPQCDPYAKKIKIVSFDALKANLTSAIDISELIDDRERSDSFGFGEFGRKSWIRWADEPAQGSSTTKYSGYLAVANEKLEPSVDIIVLPYYVTENYEGLPFIENFKLKEQQEANATELQYDQVDATPRLLVHQSRPASINILDDANNPIAIASVNRPIPRFLPDLDIKSAIIPRYYTTYQSLLDNARVIKLKALLSTSFIQNLDHSIPVYINSNKIKGSYFYLNKISEWGVGKTCLLYLIRL